MGTLGKAYGSYGAYILATSHIISFLENRAKAIIYTTAPSLMDIAQGYINLGYIQKKKEKIKKKIIQRKYIIKKYLNLETESLILPIKIGDNKNVLELQELLKANGFMVGAIRQPTVKSAILRVILKLDIKKEELKRLATLLSTHVDYA
jgi:8-amino-7-oxononanoate synthase